MYVVNSELMKQIDKYTIEQIGIPSMVLMENAARKSVKNIVNRINNKQLYNAKIIVLCGNGNNGGDGICIARIMHEMGYDISIYMVSKSSNMSKEAQSQFQIAKKCDVTFIDNLDLGKYDIVIDAIFGIGLTRDIEGDYYELIKSLNDYRELNDKNINEDDSLYLNNDEEIVKMKKIVYSIDIPSGINATTGKVMGIAVKADYTITFGLNKIGMILHPGRLFAGEVIVEDIGFPLKIIKNICKDNAYNIYIKDTLKKHLPKRISYSNKGTYGKLLVIAGAKNMAGACCMTARAAYKLGVGLVRIFTPEENRTIIQQTIPEAVLTTYKTEDGNINIESLKDLENEIDNASAIVIGPGLGTNVISKTIVLHTINYLREKYNNNKTLIIDADAINIISTLDNVDIIDNIILTPHLKELSRLSKDTINSIQDNIHEPIKIFRQIKCINQSDSNTVLVIKDAVTMTLNNKTVYMNTSGNNGLATGGSGDVLSGIIGGLVATGCSNIKAASLGAFIHGLCGDEYVKEYNPYSLNATDIINYIEKVIGGISNEEVL